MTLEKDFLASLLSVFLHRKNTQCSVVTTHPRKWREDTTGDAITGKDYARLIAQVLGSSVAKKSWWDRKTAAREAQRQAEKTGMVEEVHKNATKCRGKRATTVQCSKPCGRKSIGDKEGNSTLLHRTIGKTTFSPRCSKPGRSVHSAAHWMEGLCAWRTQALSRFSTLIVVHSLLRTP